MVSTNFSTPSINSTNFLISDESPGNLLLETGDLFLLENGDFLALEETSLESTDYTKPSINSTNYSG